MTRAVTITQDEFIGLNARIVKSSNPSYVGISGKVIDETRNTLVIRHKNQDKIIAKEVAVFHFTLGDDAVIEVEGKIIVGRPEDRMKKRIKRRW